MILVDPRLVDSLRRNNAPVPDATTQSLGQMDQTMRDILQENGVDDNNKADSYQQALWRFLKRFNQYKDKPLGRVEITKQSNEASDLETKDEEAQTQAV